MKIPATLLRRSLTRLLPLIVTLAATENAVAATRLFEIGTTRFVAHASGDVWLERGRLNALGGFTKTDESPVLSTVLVPTEARGRQLIQLEAWFAYQRLGTDAVTNFRADEQAVPFTIGARQYLTVAPNPDATLDDGKLINIATRARASATEKLIAGFVVDEQHRWVLIRAVGPGLAPHGVTDAMPDPFLTLYRGQTPVFFNGDWSTRPDAGEIADASARAGAFPLAAGSKDAALLVQLPPGTYTVHAEPETGGGGTVMIEVYSVAG